MASTNDVSTCMAGLMGGPRASWCTRLYVHGSMEDLEPLDAHVCTCMGRWEDLEPLDAHVCTCMVLWEDLEPLDAHYYWGRRSTCILAERGRMYMGSCAFLAMRQPGRPYLKLNCPYQHLMRPRICKGAMLNSPALHMPSSPPPWIAFSILQTWLHLVCNYTYVNNRSILSHMAGPPEKGNFTKKCVWSVVWWTWRVPLYLVQANTTGFNCQ